MLDNIPVYHAHDVFENMDQRIVDAFWRLCDVSYGDAAFTLIRGCVAFTFIKRASEEVGVSFTTPEDLVEDGVYFALPG